jgi:hypothetical protein
MRIGKDTTALQRWGCTRAQLVAWGLGCAVTCDLMMPFVGKSYVALYAFCGYVVPVALTHHESKSSEDGYSPSVMRPQSVPYHSEIQIS